MPVVKNNTQLLPEEKQKLKEIYYDASNPASYGGIKKLSQTARIHPKKVIKWLMSQWPYTHHKPVRKKFNRRKYVSKGLHHQWQIDLMDMQKYSRENSGMKYILTIIDIFSRQGIAIPVKNKTGPVIADALEEVFERSTKPYFIQSDLGLEFYNTHVKKVLDKYNIELFSVHSELKACIVERFIRTIKEKLHRIFTHHGNYRWIDVLPDVIKAYNNSYHRGLKHIPSKVTKVNEADIWIKQYSNLVKGKNPKFKIGDRVKISVNKRIFTKGYLQRWTDEDFFVANIDMKYNPVIYTLVDINGEEIKGSFYEYELQKVDNTEELYRIERVIRTKTTNGKKLALVKWIGYKEPSWINYNEIKHL